MYAFVSYFGSGNEEEDSEDGVEDDDVRLGLVLITADKEGFFDMKAWKDHVLQVSCPLNHPPKFCPRCTDTHHVFITD